jgi:hypothetical protein
VGYISQPAIAQSFDQAEVNQNNFVVVASPYGRNAYQLLVLEQLTNQRPCWREVGSNPTTIDPLLLQFDFTGICARSTDSNGYSVRMAGREFGLLYNLSVARRDNDLVLTATNTSDRKAPVLEIGRSNGISPGGQFAKINLNPDWRLTKRRQGEQLLGHVYLTRDNLPAGIIPSAFVDTQANWARNYIDVLAANKIISGFEDGRFRPDDPVTRVQFAAILNRAFANRAAIRGGTAFKDIQPNYWGFQAVQSAYQKGFMSGYPEGVFRPDQQIPRLEVLVALSSGLGISSQNTNVLSFYQDAAQIPVWASGAIAGATENRFVINYPRVRELSPSRPATRAEVAAFVYQSLVNAGQLPVIPSPYVVVVNPTNPATTPTTPLSPVDPAAQPSSESPGETVTPASLEAPTQPPASPTPATPPESTTSEPLTPSQPATPTTPVAPATSPPPATPPASETPPATPAPGNVVVPTIPATP